MFPEETGTPYKIIPVNIGKGEQFKPEFLAVSPNNRIPAMVDHAPADGGAPITVFESGAMLLYLAEKTGRFLSRDSARAHRCHPMAVLADGQSRSHGGTEQSFQQLRGGEDPVRHGPVPQRGQRLYGVLNRRLADRAFVAGDYSIADMAIYPWIVPYERQGQKLDDFPHLKRWFEAIRARPAVERAYAKAKEINPNPGGIRTAEERAILFGQTAASVERARSASAVDHGRHPGASERSIPEYALTRDAEFSAARPALCR